MKKFLITPMLLVVFTLNINAEYVFLKDGSIIQGQILSDTAASITIRDIDKQVKKISRTGIMRILYTKLYMGKVYVQKTDGKNVICYMVDEDSDTYTFREDLYSPKEFTLKRDQVLFMARGNPSGLQGEPGTDKIELKWFPPYSPVKKYRLYIKNSGETKFNKIDEFKGTSYTLEKLASNTKYVSYITAIDEAGDESPPSNEFTFTTQNIKPEIPDNLRIEKRTVKTTELKKGKKVQVETEKKFLSWGEVKDADGIIKGYNIYIQKNNKTEKLTATKGTDYEIPENESAADIRITAVDDRDGESPLARMEPPVVFKAGIQPLYFIPHGELAEMFDPGYGVFAYAGLKDFLIQNFEWGISLGAVKLPGKNSDKIDNLMLVPFSIDLGYHYNMTENFSLVPYAGAGYTYMKIEYSAEEYIFTGMQYKTVYTDKTKSSYEPFLKGGAMINFNYGSFYFAAGGDYGFIYETSGVKPFIEVFVRTGVPFDI